MKPKYRPVDRDELVFDVKMGLMKAREFLPRRARSVDQDPFRLAARVIVEHLELAGVRCYRKPPRKAHSIPDDIAGSNPGESSSLRTRPAPSWEK